MPLWPWLEHTFNFDYPVEKYPEILERIRGLPPRVAALLESVPPGKCTAHDGRGWSIQENIGHLVDVHILILARLDDFVAGAEVLTPVNPQDLPRPTEHHNDRPLADVMTDLREQRGRFVRRLEACTLEDWARTALHPRLNKPMRQVDHACFFAEHDDYHLARISELIRKLVK